ncbi:MAG: substrate-binding domain-containing protein [bacterium]|nr:substrate-binding domain-containing protein [bacterium]
MAKTVKLADIAKVVGVSTVSVSKCLAGKGGVSEEMKERIKQTAEQLGYISPSIMKQNRAGGTGNIGVLLPQRFVGNNTFYWNLYERLVNVLSGRGYYGILELISIEDEKNCIMPNMIPDRKVDGVIVLGQANNQYTAMIAENKVIPVIFLDYYMGRPEYDTVISDGFHGMYQLTNYLLEMGHTQIGFVGTILSTSSITDRYLGYLKAMMEKGLTPKPEWIIPDREEGNGALLDMTLPEELPTAFACNCDVVAYRLVNLLKARGLTVPEDISVVGYDNYFLEDATQEAITTYEVGMQRMAEICVKTLMKKICGERYYKGVQVVTGHIVYKKSVRRI